MMSWGACGEAGGAGCAAEHDRRVAGGDGETVLEGRRLDLPTARSDLADAADDVVAVFVARTHEATHALARALAENVAGDGDIGEIILHGGDESLDDGGIEIAGDDFDFARKTFATI